ncbi:hypothetical protein [Corynebacterium marinum]|nr:hypothetical protein [Corynebacterium marinum]
MAVARKGTLNARQRARLAVQADQDKIKRQVDLFTEALTAVDARDQAEIRLGQALNELRGMGLSRADIADRSGLTPREISAAMRAATDAETLDEEAVVEVGEGDVEVTSDGGADGSHDGHVSAHGGDDLDITGDADSDPEAAHAGDRAHAQ